MRKTKILGIVLVTTLLTIVILMMLLGTAIKLVPGAGGMAADVSGREMAQMAAQAGVNYAQTRITQDPAWMTPPFPAAAVDVVNTPALQVREDRGNVIGIMVFPTGEKAEFLIRFSPQDGSAPGNPAYIIPSPNISLNNWNGSANANVFLGNGPGWAITANSNYQCPKLNFLVTVEGFAGPGVRDVTVANPGPVGNKISRRLIEVMWAASGSSQVAGLAYSHGDTSVLASNKANLLLAKSQTGRPTISTEGNFNGIGTSFYGPKTGAEIDYGLGITYTSLTGVTKATTVTKAPPLLWNSIDKAPSGPTDTHIKAGTYVWQYSTSKGCNMLCYYDQEYNPALGIATVPDNTAANVPLDFSGYTGNAAGVPIAWSNKSQDAKFKGVADNEITITNSLVVNTTALGTSSIAFICDPNDPVHFPKAATAADPVPIGNHYNNDFAVNFSPPKGTAILTTNTSNANVWIDGQLTGTSGSITSSGNILASGKGVDLSTSPNSNSAVNMYAKGNVTVNASSVTSKGAIAVDDLSLTGVLYSWGNINCTTGDPLQKKVSLKGALVAYAGDPSSGAPGIGSPILAGKIDISAKDVDLTYDSSQVAALTKVMNKLEVVLWVNY